MSLRPIYKFFLILILTFTGLVILFSIKSVRKAHAVYFCHVISPIFNTINPNIYTEFLPFAPENDQNWTVSFKIWDLNAHGSNAYMNSYRDKNGPKIMMAQNLHELVTVPTLFLIALFLATPLNWKRKSMLFLLGLFIFYLFMTFYFSYRFEYTLLEQQLPLNSIWHIIIYFFGLGGTIDPIYVVVFLIWGLLLIPGLGKRIDMKQMMASIK